MITTREKKINKLCITNQALDRARKQHNRKKRVYPTMTTKKLFCKMITNREKRKPITYLQK